MSPNNLTTTIAELRRLHEAATNGLNWQERAQFNEACKIHLPAILDHLEAVELERDEARKENDFMRLRLAESDKACVYCDLPKAEMGRCASGFPGCARADDLFQCDELTRRDERMKREGAAEWLEQFVSEVRAERPHGLTVAIDTLSREAARLREGK